MFIPIDIFEAENWHLSGEVIAENKLKSWSGDNRRLSKFPLCPKSEMGMLVCTNSGDSFSLNQLSYSSHLLVIKKEQTPKKKTRQEANNNKNNTEV